MTPWPVLAVILLLSFSGCTENQEGSVAAPSVTLRIPHACQDERPVVSCRPGKPGEVVVSGVAWTRAAGDPTTAIEVEFDGRDVVLQDISLTGFPFPIYVAPSTCACNLTVSNARLVGPSNFGADYGFPAGASVGIFQRNDGNHSSLRALGDFILKGLEIAGFENAIVVGARSIALESSTIRCGLDGARLDGERVSVEALTVSGCHGVALYSQSESITVAHSHLDWNWQGAFLQNDVVEVTTSSFVGNAVGGLRVPREQVAIRSSTFADNGGGTGNYDAPRIGVVRHGLDFGGVGAASISVHASCFDANADWGLWAPTDRAASIDAGGNWWGAPEGPGRAAMVGGRPVLLTGGITSGDTVALEVPVPDWLDRRPDACPVPASPP